jgi:tryptophanyl-tRNA synthetase
MTSTDTADTAETAVVGDVQTPSVTVRRKRVLSGVQPTGLLHLGNYLGAIRQWVQYQHDFESFFCVVDLHAITAPHDPKMLASNTLMAAATYLAAGVDPKISKVFVQSHISAHAELTWLFNCITPMNWLERMIQYKVSSQSSCACARSGPYVVACPWTWLECSS